MKGGVGWDVCHREGGAIGSVVVDKLDSVEM